MKKEGGMSATGPLIAKIHGKSGTESVPEKSS